MFSYLAGPLDMTEYIRHTSLQHYAYCVCLKLWCNFKVCQVWDVLSDSIPEKTAQKLKNCSKILSKIEEKLHVYIHLMINNFVNNVKNYSLWSSYRKIRLSKSIHAFCAKNADRRSQEKSMTVVQAFHTHYEVKVTTFWYIFDRKWNVGQICGSSYTWE